MLEKLWYIIPGFFYLFPLAVYQYFKPFIPWFAREDFIKITTGSEFLVLTLSFTVGFAIHQAQFIFPVQNLFENGFRKIVLGEILKYLSPQERAKICKISKVKFAKFILDYERHNNNIPSKWFKQKKIKWDILKSFVSLFFSNIFVVLTFLIGGMFKWFDSYIALMIIFLAILFALCFGISAIIIYKKILDEEQFFVTLHKEEIKKTLEKYLSAIEHQ